METERILAMSSFVDWHSEKGVFFVRISSRHMPKAYMSVFSLYTLESMISGAM